MIRRMYHVSCVVHNVKKAGLKLNKMLNPKSKKRFYPFDMFNTAPLPSVKSLTKQKYVPGKQGVRRLAMLNKMFMKQITDLMSTGTISLDIVGRGIDISKVQITPDFQTLNVFWVCKGDSSDVEIEKLLNQTAGALRHELSTLRVMGEVPYVVFVKDKQEAMLVDLDRRLAIADYGEEYTPTDLGHLLKTDFTLDMKLSPEMQAKIKQLESETHIIEEPLPDITHNVYGLDHDKIMARLLAARKRSKDAWRNIGEDSPVISYRAPTLAPAAGLGKASAVDVVTQKHELSDFLMKRQILQNKLHKQTMDARKVYNVEMDNKNDEEEHYEAQEYEEDEDYPYYDDVDISDNRSKDSSS